MGANDSADDDGTAYRSDLAEVVKPRRPAAAATRTDRPSEPRPAPLKLVAEQRIDINYAKPDTAAPVRPRRVAAVAPTPAAAAPVDGGFVKFAADMGASTLSELLEASAAYLSFVEGIDQFSRPQLMQTVRLAETEDFSREEGLRAFGQLLRAGKLIKLDGGRFKASDDIGYQPEERAAG
jgi:pilus assembly protein FimV